MRNINLEQMKGGILNMKLGILLIALLFLSIFAVAVVYADSDSDDDDDDNDNDDEDKEDENDEDEEEEKFEFRSNRKILRIKFESKEKFEIKAKGLDELEDLDFSRFEKGKILDKVKEFNDKRKLGFAESWRGNGHISNGESGYLISAFWILQKFAEVDNNSEDNTDNNSSENNETNSNETNQTEPEEIIEERVFGNIKITKGENFRIVMKERNENSFTFYVLPKGNGDKSLTIEEAAEISIGTFTLNIDEEFIGLTTWTGSLDLDSTDLSGSWSVVLATENNVVKPTRFNIDDNDDDNDNEDNGKEDSEIKIEVKTKDKKSGSDVRIKIEGVSEAESLNILERILKFIFWE